MLRIRKTDCSLVITSVCHSWKGERRKPEEGIPGALKKNASRPSSWDDADACLPGAIGVREMTFKAPSGCLFLKKVEGADIFSFVLNILGAQKGLGGLKAALLKTYPN